MAEFYDHPETGRLHFRGAAGGGGSFFDGLATETDIRQHSTEHARYLAHKHAEAARATVPADEAFHSDAEVEPEEPEHRDDADEAS